MIKYTINIEENDAAKKNEFLKKAREEGADYVFFVQNDINVIDESVYDVYIEHMKKYKLGVAYYSFYGNYNRLFNGIPNPSAIIRINEDTELYINRIIVDTFICIDLNMVNFDFNEDVKALEFNHFLWKAKAAEIIPFYGFFFEPEESWKYFGKEHIIEKGPTKTIQMTGEDQRYFKENNIDLSHPQALDCLLDYLKEKYE